MPSATTRRHCRWSGSLPARPELAGGNYDRRVDLRAVVLVEGISDKAALETLAERHGRDLEAEGVSVVPIGGAQAIRRFVDQFGPGGLGVTVAGLCDAGEEAD